MTEHTSTFCDIRVGRAAVTSFDVLPACRQGTLTEQAGARTISTLCNAGSMLLSGS